MFVLFLIASGMTIILGGYRTLVGPLVGGIVPAGQPVPGRAP